MSGFTLGGDAGATLGGATGGTLGTAVDEWQIGTLVAADRIAETATPARLTLTFRVSRADLLSVFRPLKSDEGKYRVFADDSGGYRAVDTAGGANTYRLSPPASRRPLRRDVDIHIDRYEEELVETTGDEWDVTLELVPAASRSDIGRVGLPEQVPAVESTGGTLGDAAGFTLGGEAGATLGTATTLPLDWWGFESVNGTIATDRVDADVTGVGEGGVDRATLTLKLTFDQAYALETALAQNRGTRVRTIEDGTNRAVDETADGSNTLTITSPDEDTLPSGEYVVVEPFESTRLNDSWQVVELEIVPTD